MDPQAGKPGVHRGLGAVLVDRRPVVSMRPEGSLGLGMAVHLGLRLAVVRALAMRLIAMLLDGAMLALAMLGPLRVAHMVVHGPSLPVALGRG